MPDNRKQNIRRKKPTPVRAWLIVSAAIFISLISPAQNSNRVDLALVLAVDCSHSVSRQEFELQMQGLAQAFSDPEVIAAILSGVEGRIAVTLVEWSGLNAQKIALDWTIIGDAGSAGRVSRIIAEAPRMAEGKTSISAVIDFSLRLLGRSPGTAYRQVIDISGDGVNNIGEAVETARDRAIAAGITINGLAILNNVAHLHRYFEDSVVGGPGHFVMQADDYEAYGEAIKLKLLKEIKGQPVS